MQHQILGIDQNLPLLAFDLLARVIPMRVDVCAALFRSLDALGIDDRHGRTGFPRDLLSAFGVERVAHALRGVNLEFRWPVLCGCTGQQEVLAYMPLPPPPPPSEPAAGRNVRPPCAAG